MDIREDDRLLALLQQDGRTPCADLAAAADMAEPTVRLSVRPARLLEVAEALAAHPEAALVAATTGPTNLLAKAVCRDVDALYTYLTNRVATIDAIDHLETAPVIRTLKRAASFGW